MNVSLEHRSLQGFLLTVYVALDVRFDCRAW